MSSARVGFLFGLLIIILIAIGSFWGTSGMLIALVFALAINLFSYYYSDKIVLRMYGAKLVTEKEEPRLHKIVSELAHKAKIPKPKVAVMHMDVPNAFATGRNKEHATVCATTGILDILDDDELEGVFAHEISHIRNRDILVGTVAATMAGAIMMVGRFAWFASMGSNRRSQGSGLMFLILVILTPLAAMLIQMAISRSREYLADETGAKLSGKPFALASALQKISSSVRRKPLQRGNPATAHLFIVNPFSGIDFISLFSTHPPIEKRVERLKSLKL